MVVQGWAQSASVIIVLVGPRKRRANSRNEPGMQEAATYENKQQVVLYYYFSSTHSSEICKYWLSVQMLSAFPCSFWEHTDMKHNPQIAIPRMHCFPTNGRRFLNFISVSVKSAWQLLKCLISWLIMAHPGVTAVKSAPAWLPLAMQKSRGWGEVGGSDWKDAEHWFMFSGKNTDN